MKNLIDKIEPGKYIVAVSGGVDSMALLHALKDLPHIDLLVAHVNHGIRPDSETMLDEQLVKKMCAEWNIELELTNLNLGSKASEEVARTKRHDYLQQLLKSKSYNKIITAHHKDDVIETIVINLLRGTGRKGLSSLKNDKIYLRPLLNVSKNDIKQYAISNKLVWNEDSTNSNQEILRNYVRLTILPKLEQNNTNIKDELFDIYQQMLEINQKADIEISNLETELKQNNGFDRKLIIMLPIEVSYSFLHHVLSQLYAVEVDSKMLTQVRNFIHTAKTGKVFNINKNLNLTCDSKTISFTSN